ncbi:MAG: TnpV protein [Oscillospiraceae bacterium]|jgi:hypothetical protein|nr:TnpV protein [Oscillospiraceae bacterium]
MASITYTQVGDYLLPDITLSDPKDAPLIGRYGKMRRAFLKERRAIEYSRLLLTEQLFPYLREVDEIANERRRNGTPESVDESIATRIQGNDYRISQRFACRRTAANGCYENLGGALTAYKIDSFHWEATTAHRWSCAIS